MRTLTGLLAILLMALLLASSFPKARAEAVPQRMTDARACNIQYDGIVVEAKAALTKGDRQTALTSLLRARSLLQRCEELQPPSSDPTVLLGSLTTPADTSGRARRFS